MYNYDANTLCEPEAIECVECDRCGTRYPIEDIYNYGKMDEEDLCKECNHYEGNREVVDKADED